MKKTNVVSTSKVGFVAPTEFGEHPQHAKFFLAAEEKKKTASYHKSIGKFGKVNQVVYINKDGQKLVIDGWGYVLYAINNNIPEVAAICLDLTSDEDITQIMLELQFSDHSTPEEEYKIYKAAFELFSKGKGHRTDVYGIDEEDWEQEKKRRITVYDRIATMTNASSGKRVQGILKVGNVKPELLRIMEADKMSLYAAFLKCMPPKVKKPATTSNDTGVPKFTVPTITADAQKKFDMSLEEALAAARNAIVKTDDYYVTEEGDKLVVYSFCQNCGVASKIPVSKELLQHD